MDGLFPYSGFFIVNVDVPDSAKQDTTIIELFATESILSPSLQTTFSVQSTIHDPLFKNYDDYRGALASIQAYNPNIVMGDSAEPVMWEISQNIYRMENRKQINYQMEEFYLHACDPTVISNYEQRISQNYPCKTPTEVASEALAAVGAHIGTVEASQPARDYQAANIYPFQVLAEQADVALNGTDPSFLHFMTYENGGTHHFRSVLGMTTQESKWSFVYNEKGAGIQLGDPHNIMSYEFPCDFDLLTDVMNGISPTGQVEASTTIINPFNSIASFIGGAISQFGGMGKAVHNSAITSEGSEDNNCGTSVQDYVSVRQARLALDQPDKIALRMIVPFNPVVHAGDMIDVLFSNKIEEADYTDDYGTGNYLIVALTHNIKSGGYGTTTLDCVSQSVGIGQV